MSSSPRLANLRSKLHRQLAAAGAPSAAALRTYIIRAEEAAWDSTSTIVRPAMDGDFLPLVDLYREWLEWDRDLVFHHPFHILRQEFLSQLTEEAIREP